MHTLIISCSLNPSSRSRVLAHQALVTMKRDGYEAQLIDLRDFTLPLCDAHTCGNSPDVGRIAQLIADAGAIIIACPIYNYDVSAATKNLVELTGGNAWGDKVVAFLCAAGGRASYMAVLGLANSLMLDFRCLIVPRFVFANKDAFAEERVVSEEIIKRIDQLCRTTVMLTHALTPAPKV